MNIKDANRVTYRYKWRLLPAAWVLIFMPLVSLLGVTWILRQGWEGGSIFLVISVSSVLLIGWILIMGLSDITIDGEGIYRKAFGLTWQKMKWSDAVKLHISKSVNPQDGRPTRSYVLVSAKNSGNFFSRRITFQEREQGMDDLLQKFKAYVDLHGVQITDVSMQ